MALSVHTNVASLSTQKNLNRASDALSTSMQRLSSGLRINSAKDDAAGLQIANRLTSQINGLNVAIKNANDGISMAQTAEAAMGESTTILQRMRELALQSANGSYGGEERKAMQAEYAQLTAELNRIAETTSFGSKKLLDGSFGTTAFQVGANAYETINLTMNSVAASEIGTNQAGSTALSGAALVSGAATAGGTYTISAGAEEKTSKAFAAGASAKEVARELNGLVAGVSATARTVVQLNFTDNPATNFTFKMSVGGVEASFANIGTKEELFRQLNDQAATLNIAVDAEAGTITSSSGENIVFKDVTGTAGAFTFNTIGADGKASTTAVNVDSDVVASGSVQLDSAKGFSVYASAAGNFFDEATNTTASELVSVQNSKITSADDAQKAIFALDKAIANIDAQRADLGAVQNRFDSTISNLTAIAENTTASRGRIQDVDFANETAELTKQQTLQQASTAILAQANQLPAAVLKLLG
jgi:flagellin